MVAEYSRYAAEGLESMAQSLDRREVGEFVENIEQFARERPVAFISGAMVAGFALARIHEELVRPARAAVRTQL